MRLSSVVFPPCILAALSALASAAGTGEIEVPADVLQDKIRGGLLGQMIGDLNGLVHEMKYIAEPGDVLGYVPALPEGAWTDDDTDLEWVYVLALEERRATSIPFPEIPALWKVHVNRKIWCANHYARQLMDLGLDPPLTGQVQFNPWSEFNISGQFVCETWGLVAPAMPRTAARIGLGFTRVTIDGEPAQTTQLFDAMIATAFVTDDLDTVLDAGMAAVDPRSEVRRIAADVRAFHRAHPGDWRATRREVKEKYSRFGGEMRDRNGFELNTASVIGALLHGERDFIRTAVTAFDFGWDTDNNAATACTIVGVMKGRRWMMDQGWKIKDLYRNTTRDDMPAGETITRFGDRLIALAERVIAVGGGGKVTRDGKAFYRIRTEEPGNVEPLVEPQERSRRLREALVPRIEEALGGGASGADLARAAYQAICLDLAPALKEKHPRRWAEALAALGAFPRLIEALFTSPVPAAKGLRERALEAGLSRPEPACRVLVKGPEVELHAPSFVLHLDTAKGLRAVSWQNRLTGRTITLGSGPELEVDNGPLQGPLKTPEWRASAPAIGKSGEEGEAVFELAAGDPALAARVTYRWNDREPVLRKSVEVSNRGERAVSLLNVRLGSYRTGAKVEEREQGFPLYLDGEFFLGLTHPAGWASGRDGVASLRQYPGTELPAGGKFACMEAVYGVGEAGAARKSFVAHLKGRMRRVVRGHDRPYAIFDNFGSWDLKDLSLFVLNSDEFMLHSLGRLAESQEAAGPRFDICNVHFWVDHAGDLKRFDPRRFPEGIAKVKERLDRLGIAPGLWIDSSMASWSIGLNPAARPSLSDDPGFFCRASEPIRSMYKEAFIHHIRTNGIRELKFDNLRTICNKTDHGHLPGLYSTEAIESSVIDFLGALDAECPEVFLILYWGHRSPWWLLHGDTLFDSGLGIEAATPSSQPAPYARDSVTQKLDQAQWSCVDLPPLGKDSLGVWLSDWGWNSSIGKERWQEGVVMDMSRGSLLIQMWADRDWLSPPEWKELGDFISLLRARPRCFANPRFILGSPWKDEPYGYSCADGARAFLALDNSTWKDSVLTLDLGPAWGLPAGRRWALYRWYPEPARLVGAGDTFGEKAEIALRPFEVVLLEAVEAGGPPALEREFSPRPIPAAFAEASRSVELSVRRLEAGTGGEPPPAWTVLKPEAAVSAGGASLEALADGSVLAGGKNPSPDLATITASTDLTGITAVRLEVLPDPSLPSGGPGRAFNGNFALNEFGLTAEASDRPGAGTKVALKASRADFSQTSHGGWPVAAALDGDPGTAWSIDPQEGYPHAAVFETAQPVGYPGGTKLTFALGQGYRAGMPLDHTIGRLRLSVTTAPPPIAPPAGYGKRPLAVAAAVPASAAGGMLVIAAELKRGGKPVSFGDIGGHFAAEARLEGRPVPCRPILGIATYPSSWQGWRIVLEPAGGARALEVVITDSLPADVECSLRGYFLPR